MKKKTRSSWVLEIIGIILFVVTLIPFYIVVVGASKTPFEISVNPFGLPADWSNLVKNLVHIWTDKNIRYQSSFLASVLVTVLSLALLLPLASQAAWVLVRAKTKLSGFIFTVFIAAMVIPFQVLMLPLVSWFRTLGDAIGIPLLRSYAGIILAYLGFGVPLSIFIYHGFIKSIPVELEEAAQIDGCTRFGVFYKIIFPNLTSIHMTVLVLNGIWIWNDYLLPLLLLGKGKAIMTIPLAVSNFAGAYVKQWDLIMTAILIAMLPVIVVFLIAQKHIVKGMVAGAIK